MAINLGLFFFLCSRFSLKVFPNMIEEKQYKTAAIISLIVLGVLFVWSIVFYKERMFFVDATYIAFKAINEEKLQIQQFRFGAFITQIVPVIGAKLHLSIKTILVAYSASFNLFYLITGLILFFWFRLYTLVILLAFYFTLISTDTYYWTNNEVHQGVAWMFLFYGGQIYYGREKQGWVIPILLILVLGTTALFSHPLVIVPFVFLWVFFLVEKQLPYSRRQLIVFSMIMLLPVIAKVIVSKFYANYDTEKLNEVSNLKPRDLYLVFQSPFAKQIYGHILSNFWIAGILFLSGIAVMFKQRKHLLMTWTFGCCFAFFVAACLTFGEYAPFYSESELMPGVILVTAPFVFFILPRLKNRHAIIIISLIFLSRLINIHSSRDIFKQRVEAIAGIVSQMKKENFTKLIMVKNDDAVPKPWIIEWAMPTESILYSAMLGDRPVRTYTFSKEDKIDQRVLNDRYLFQSDFEVLHSGYLNPYYFSIDTVNVYRKLPYQEFKLKSKN
jgi:hypothetical protein